MVARNAPVHTSHMPVFFPRLRTCRSCKATHSFFWKCSKCRSLVCTKCSRLVGGVAVCRECSGAYIDPLHLRAAVVLFFIAVSLLFLVLV